MKHLFMVILVTLALPASIASCSPGIPEPDSGIQQPVIPEPPQMPGGNENPGGEGGNEDNGDNNNNGNDMSNKLRIKIGSASFTATLEDNAATNAFKAHLPMTMTMSELNGNEKYYYLPESLPTAASNPGTVRAGDLMLFGSSCLVLFYAPFPTSYSYSRLARVDNASGLAPALGPDSVSVTIELQ